MLTTIIFFRHHSDYNGTRCICRRQQLLSNVVNFFFSFHSLLNRRPKRLIKPLIFTTILLLRYFNLFFGYNRVYMEENVFYDSVMFVIVFYFAKKKKANKSTFQLVSPKQIYIYHFRNTVIFSRVSGDIRVREVPFC